MPVGTQGTVKGVEMDQLRATGAEMILANTYHLAVRPGANLVSRLGELHKFMGWDGPILTDSGGFQIFSLAQLAKITEEGAEFRTHTDGRSFTMTPEDSVRIQELLGSDIAMVLDHVVALPNDRETIQDACDRSTRWAARCRKVHRRPQQAQFGIVQGGLHVELRQQHAADLVKIGFEGYAIGGLSVGERPEQMYAMLDVTCTCLPVDQPRYLMGVGRPEDLIEGIRRGVDLFDCVMPTRNGRNGLAFTDQGAVRIRNQAHSEDERPLQEGCPCPACRRSRGYLRHLFLAGEMLGPSLLSIHNLTYYQQLMQDSRRAIEAGQFTEFAAQKTAGWQAGCASSGGALS